jgi:cell division protein FtsB
MIPKRNLRRSDLRRRHRLHWTLWISAAILITGYFATLLIFSDKGLAKLWELTQTHRRLTQEIKGLEERNEKLRQKAQALRQDPEAIESIARQELGLAKKGELIYQFKEQPSP